VTSSSDSGWIGRNFWKTAASSSGVGSDRLTQTNTSSATAAADAGSPSSPDCSQREPFQRWTVIIWRSRNRGERRGARGVGMIWREGRK
jgi:hypothetical protein